MIEAEPVVIAGTKTFRYRSPMANHILIIDATSFASAPGFSDFAAFHAHHAADIWCLDQGAESRLDIEGCAQSLVAVAEHVAATGAALPMFALGVLDGGAAACRAVFRCPALRGAILVGPVHADAEMGSPARRCETLPPPTLRILGGRDLKAIQLPPGRLTEAELYVHHERLSELMNSPAALSAVAYEWCTRHMNNHLNPRWWG
jgi:hypothetical protein